MSALSEKFEKDDQKVWECYWKHYKEAGDKAPKLLRSYFEEKVYQETGYQPITIRRKINKMLRNRPIPCQ